MRRIFLGILLCAATADAQKSSETASTDPTYLAPAFPAKVTALLDQYGDRLRKPGNERVTLSGTFTNSAGAKPAVVTAEIPGKISVSLVGKAVVYDGARSSTDGATPTSSDEDLLESLQADTIENFFYSFGRTAAVRLLGSRFRLTDTRDDKGPWYDIYELTQPVSARSDKALRQKLYYFDSSTGQFYQCRYKIVRDGQTVEVLTIFSGWSKVNGQSAPARIERFENGNSVFSLTVNTSQFQKAVQDSVFTAKP